jgi:precorrin-6B methylase 2
VTTVSLATLAVLAGCTSNPAPPAGSTQIVVRLPKFEQFPDLDGKPRANRLTVAGREQPLDASQSGKEVTALVEPGEKVEVEVTFWPVRYSKSVRKKTVAVKAGEKAEADLSEADPERPDHLEAIYFPTSKDLLAALMKAGEVGKDDRVLDIGCGDGRLVITAVKDYGARSGVGVDIQPELVDLSNETAKKAGVADRCAFRVEDALKMKDVSEYSVVFLYLGEELSARLQPLLRNTLKPGSRVVSHTFPVGDWKPDEVKNVMCKNNYGRDQEFPVYVYRVK